MVPKVVLHCFAHFIKVQVLQRCMAWPTLYCPLSRGLTASIVSDPFRFNGQPIVQMHNYVCMCTIQLLVVIGQYRLWSWESTLCAPRALYQEAHTLNQTNDFRICSLCTLQPWTIRMSEGQSKVNRLSISLPFLRRFQSIRLDALSHKIQNRFA